jgi:hypothetical protein
MQSRTALEENQNPNRNIPIAQIVPPLAVCTVFLHAGQSRARVGAGGALPIMGADGMELHPSVLQLGGCCVVPELARPARAATELVCSNHEPLAHELRILGLPGLGNANGIAAAHGPTLGHPDE